MDRCLILQAMHGATGELGEYPNQDLDRCKAISRRQTKSSLAKYALEALAAAFAEYAGAAEGWAALAFVSSLSALSQASVPASTFSCSRVYWIQHAKIDIRALISKTSH